MYMRKILMGCLWAPLAMGIILAIACAMMGCTSEQKETSSVVRERVCFDYLPGK